MLYIIATPIGNLGDMSLRAIETLKSCSYVLAEDTRQSLKLFSHFSIETPLISFHEHNQKSRIEKVIHDLQQGQNIALISDAGTPLISDPGEPLIQRCIEDGVPVSHVPGPVAAVVALTLSGFETIPFQCVGFLPRKPKEYLTELLSYSGTTIAYESPQRIEATLTIIHELDPTRKVAVARELTKKFESCYRGTAAAVKAALPQPVKGEIVLLISKGEKRAPSEAEVLRLIHELRSNGTSIKEVATELSKEFNLSKRSLYQLMVEKNL